MIYLKTTKNISSSLQELRKCGFYRFIMLMLSKMFIRAKKSSYLNLHVAAISKMLNFFAATWHIRYAKSA